MISKDQTLNQAKKFNPGKFKFKIIYLKKNLGYVQCQKSYHYSIKNNFDIVVLSHCQNI